LVCEFHVFPSFLGFHLLFTALAVDCAKIEGWPDDFFIFPRRIFVSILAC